jgi:hypothetical protein
MSVDINVRSVGNTSLQAGRDSRSTDIDPVSSDIDSMAVGNASLRGDTVPMSSGILPM